MTEDDEDGVNTALHVLAGHGPGCMISDEDFEERGNVPTYGVDQTTPLDHRGNLGLVPVPHYMPSREA